MTAEKRRHPHFDDRGTLDWSTSWKEASERARAEGKLVFVELGREICGNCRNLVQAVVPRPDVAPLLQERFVALAGDADDPEPDVHRLIFRLRDATTLPFVLLVDPDGKVLAGAAGPQDPAAFRALLEKATG